MKIEKFYVLRRFIKEELDRLVRRSAGFGGGTGIAGRGRGSAEIDPIGLGEEGQETQEEYGKEQEKSQFAARVDKRRRQAGQN